jgi:hypothetical protein
MVFVMNNEDWSPRDDHIILGVIFFFHGAYAILVMGLLLYGFIQWWIS